MYPGYITGQGQQGQGGIPNSSHQGNNRYNNSSSPYPSMPYMSQLSPNNTQGINSSTSNPSGTSNSQQQFYMGYPNMNQSMMNNMGRYSGYPYMNKPGMNNNNNNSNNINNG